MKNFFIVVDFNISRLFLTFRNRVAVQCQKNLDRVRLKRVAEKLKKHPGYYISSHPSGLIIATQNLLADSEEEEEEEEEEESGSR